MEIEAEIERAYNLGFKHGKNDIENKQKLLGEFFLFFRDNGERHIGMIIEQFVDEFLITNKNKVT